MGRPLACLFFGAAVGASSCGGLGAQFALVPAAWIPTPCAPVHPKYDAPHACVRALQVLFRSLHRLLMDTAAHEYLFCLELWGGDQEGAYRDLFAPIRAFVETSLAAALQARIAAGRGAVSAACCLLPLRQLLLALPPSPPHSQRLPTLALLRCCGTLTPPPPRYPAPPLTPTLQHATQEMYDPLAVLLMIRINRENTLAMNRTRNPALDGYFDRINLLLWPRRKVRRRRWW